ncbi:tetratricopeptide repeat 6 isoform X1 [Pelobates cultripes]|uniref:Tetratricopeptide repeat 6 isoform X1 n=2 Tax=Pelobates cultripes TaxID=61616 RepID=A0AAD1TJI7_PELCU|nr:tetratricopeptide repeat 6 isoform X1 [Pelobates cultripes]
MSDRRGHLHFRLNYAEEFRLKKDLERLLKRPQRDSRPAITESRPGSDLASSRCDRLDSARSLRSGIINDFAGLTCKSPDTVKSPDHIDQNSNLKGRPILQNVRTLPQNTVEEYRDYKEPQHDPSHTNLERVTLDSHPKMPAIASLAGTTKCVSVFIRPEPPAKPRSCVPQIPSRPRISKKPPAGKKEREISKPTSNVYLNRKKPVDAKTHHTSSPDSNISSSSTDSDSEDSDYSKSRKKSRKKQKKRVLKKEDTLSAKEKFMEEEIVTSDLQSSGTQISEATESLSHDGQGSKITDTPPESRIPLTPPVKAKARSVDEIIASLRSPQTYTASDLKIKQLMESVLGIPYDITVKEVAEEHVQETQDSKELPSTEFLPPEQVSSIHVPQASDSVSGEITSIEITCEAPFSDIDTSIQDKSISAVEESVMTELEAKYILETPSHVSLSDIIKVKGEAVPLKTRENVKLHSSAALLATWEPTTKEHDQKTIHHFCTVLPSHILPSNLQLASRIHHTVDRKGHHMSTAGKEDLPNMDLREFPTGEKSHDKLQEELKDFTGILETGVSISALQRQNQTGSVISKPPHSARSLEDWQKIAEYYVEGPRMELVGEKAIMNSETLKMFWAPAPPKFSAPLSHIQRTLFDKYESCMEEQEMGDELSFLEEESESSDEEADPETQALRDRILSRRYNSLPDLNSPTALPSYHPLKSSLSLSAPDIFEHRDTQFNLSADFQTSMKELELLRRLSQKQASTPNLYPNLDTEPNVTHVTEPVPTQPENILTMSLPKEIQKPLYLPPKPDLKSVPLHKQKKSRRRKQLDPGKLQIIFHQLNQPPRTIERSLSLVRLPTGVRPCSGYRSRSYSLPGQLDFSSFRNMYGAVHPEEDTREWVREIWNKWFDEVFPPSSASLQSTEDYFDDAQKDLEKHDGQKEVSMMPVLDSVLPLLIEDPTATVQDVETEITRLSLLIEGEKKTLPIHYCRRGALNRKLGHLRLALQDLDLAIKQEPQLLDAYWHRHLIYLLEGKSNEALDDLNVIIKFNKTHADAYLSKAEIFKQKKDFTMSILSYSQALKCRPQDDDIYFRRALMYEAQDDIIIAMDDYAKCFYHNPSRTDALMKHGLHYFENGSWTAAVQDFTSLIKQDFNNADARIYRGRAYTKLGHYSEAVEDYSAAIHFDPNNWLAFYYRGCLLRKGNPQQALQDFSISVLLNNDFENVNAFLHRGILYTDLGMWTEAAFDFECVLALDKTVVLAHVNLGLIALQYQHRYSQAVRHFSAALRLNPTYLRAYLCRAQAYEKANDLHSALKDITRAIHLCPDSPQPYLIRGQYLYEMKRDDLASFCIHHAAAMTQGFSPDQQALVQSFCHQYNNAIECLISAIKVKPTPTLMVLLGKIQMKAKKNKDAAESFIQALEVLGSSDQQPSPSEKAEIFYLLGLCYIEQFKFLQALDAFSSAVKVHSGYCEAYYQRGLCLALLHQANSLKDFNRALEINSKYFQAYLCRAAFYGFRKRYSKAIMNCNAAIKVQPNSVRAYLYRGALKYHIKAYKLAIQDLNKAAELDPSCSLVYYNRGVCYHQSKLYDKALTDYGIVLLLGGWKETEIKVLVNRGLLYHELGDYANALEDFKSVATKTPEDIKIHQVIGNCYHRLQEYKEAVQAFNQMLKLNPLSPEGYIGRGNAYLEYGHKNATKHALRDFIKALHLSPKCIAARICLGYNLQALGLYQRAWNQFTVALDIDAHSMLGFEGRSIVNLQMGNTFAALQDMNAAIKLGVTAQLLTNRGVIHQMMGKLPNAMKDYQAAVTADPTYALAYFNAANLYLHNRQFVQAKQYYTQAIQLDPGNESAVLNRGITNMLLKDLHGALQDFQMVINLCPVSSSVYFNRANLHYMMKLYEQAESDISQALVLQPDDPLMYKLRSDVRGKLGLQNEAIEDYKRAITLFEKSC